MERYLVEFKTKDNEEDYCFILAESPLDAKKWVEDYIHVSVIRVSLIDIHDESNKEKEVLWELGENKTEVSNINEISQIQEEKPSNTVLMLRNIVKEIVKDLSVAKNEDDIYNIYNKFSDEKSMLDEILIDLKESTHDSNDKSDTKERDE